MIFTTLTMAQMGNVMAVRSDTDSTFKIGFLSNRVLIGAVLLTMALQMAVIYLPFLQNIFNTTRLAGDRSAGQPGIECCAVLRGRDHQMDAPAKSR